MILLDVMLSLNLPPYSFEVTFLTEPGACGILARLVASKVQQCSCLHSIPASQILHCRHALSLACSLDESWGFEPRSSCFHGKFSLPTVPSLSPSNFSFYDYWNSDYFYNHVCKYRVLRVHSKMFVKRKKLWPWRSDSNYRHLLGAVEKWLGLQLCVPEA